MEWEPIAAAAADEAGLPGGELLGDFLPRLADACAAGELVDRVDRAALSRFRTLGGRAADQGVTLPRLIDLYLSAAWRAWRELPAVGSDDAADVRRAGDIVLHAADDVVVAVGEGFAAARRATVRLEASRRREFVDDLLAGAGDPVELAVRAEGFGLDLSASHAVVVVRAPRPLQDTSPRVSRAASALARVGVADFLVTTRHGLMVAVLPTASAVDGLALGSDERVGVGRTHSGASGVTRSYDEALDSLALADRLGLTDRVVRADNLLVYQVLLRDRAAIGDLIDAVLAPLRAARGGMRPLLDTIDAYLSTGGNATAAARHLHLSVRAVTYRLDRIHELTGHDPDRPEDRFVLQAALMGARALGWPEVDLADARQS